MSIYIACPSCGQSRRVSANDTGTDTECVKCGQKFAIPPNPPFLATFLPPTPPPIAPPIKPPPLPLITPKSLPNGPQLIIGGLAALSACLAIALVAIVIRNWDDGKVTAANEPPKATASAEKAALSTAPLNKAPEWNQADEKIEVSNELTEVVATVMPSVVTIRVKRGDMEASLGSGFFFRDDETIATNFHVIRGATSATVVLHNGRVISVVGFIAAVPGKDLALLRLDRNVEGAIPLATSDVPPKQAESVVALGAPHRLSGTVSDGIVSAIRKGHELSATLPGVYGYIFAYDMDATWVQTTAPISPGNSGGPLINRDGRVVAVNSWQRTPSDSQNLNFAISAEHLNVLGAELHPRVLPLADLPVPDKTPAELALEKADKKRAEKDKLAIDRAEREHKRALDAIEKSQASGERQARLNRLNSQILQVRGELSQIEAEGTSLTERRGQVLAKGRAVFLVGSQIAQRISVVVSRGKALNGAIRRRELAVAGGPIVLDSFEASFDSSGLAALRREYILLDAELRALRAEAAVAEARLVELDSEARSLLGQIEYKQKERDAKRAELEALSDEIERLSRD